jgi:hypothetical protein
MFDAMMDQEFENTECKFNGIWSTDAEKSYINHIGETLSPRFKRRSKLQLLKMYRKALDKRVRWDRLMSQTIYAYVDSLIAKLGRK